MTNATIGVPISDTGQKLNKFGLVYVYFIKDESNVVLFIYT